MESNFSRFTACCIKCPFGDFKRSEFNWLLRSLIRISLVIGGRGFGQAGSNLITVLIMMDEDRSSTLWRSEIAVMVESRGGWGERAKEVGGV